MISTLSKERTGRSLTREDRRGIKFKLDDPTLSQFSKLCRLIMEAGEDTFLVYLRNRIQDEECLSVWLSRPEIHKVLRRLRIRKLITEEEWQQLYPADKRLMDLSSFSLTLRFLLIKYVCNIKKPYPNGWTELPWELDESSGAQLVRYSLVRSRMSRMTNLDEDTYHSMMREIRKYLTHFGGDIAKAKIAEIRKEGVSKENYLLWVDKFKEWHVREEEIAEKEEGLVASRQSRSADIPQLQSRIITRKERYGANSAAARANQQSRMEKKLSVGKYLPPPNAKNRWAEIPVGMVTEEKNILEKYYDRITTEVKAEAIIDQLLSRKVINMEESNDVFSILKSTEQMKILIDILVTRPGNTFQELMNCIKPRYIALYNDINEEYVKVSEQIKAMKPEGVPYCQTLLKKRYKDICESWRPILWYPEIEVNLLDFYCPLQLYDIKGKSVELDAILKPDKSGNTPRLVVIEGEAGTGKSTLAKYLAHCWAENESFFGRHFELAFYVDLKIPAASLKIMMIEQLYGSNFKLTERELWEVIDDHQEISLLILDGFEDNVTVDTMDIIRGHVAQEVTIILMSMSKFTTQIKKRCDRKFILSGFAKRKAEDFVKKYCKLSKKPREQFSRFLNKLMPKGELIQSEATAEIEFKISPLPQMKLETIMAADEKDKADGGSEDQGNESSTAVRQRAGSIIPGTLMGFGKNKQDTFINKKKWQNQNEEPGSDGEESSIKQERYSVLRYFAHIPLYCAYFCAMTDLKLSIDLSSWTGMIEQFLNAIKMKLIEREKESRLNVNKTYSQIADIAMDTIKNGICTVFPKDYDNGCLVRFGVLQEAVNLTNHAHDRFYFPNRIVQEYLASKSIDMSGLDEASRFFQGCNLTRHLHNVAIFYCGLRRNDYETMAQRALFNKITEINRRTPPIGYIKSNDNHNGAQGNILDYQFSLECIALMEGKREATLAVVETLPECMQIQNEGPVPVNTLLGMSYIIDVNHAKVSEIHVKLDLFSYQSPSVYMKLAESIKNSAKIKKLKIIWQERELMSDFFNAVCEDGCRVETLELVDESKKKADKLQPKTINNIRNACQSMEKIKCFGFKNCHHLGLVNSVIKNLPLTLNELDFSGCDINIIGSQDLAVKVSKSRDLSKVTMARVRIESMAFNTFVKAFCTNRSVTDLNLSGISLDNVCVFALSEALKVNNKIERLVMKKTKFTERSCSEMAQVMKINTAMKELHVTNSYVPAKGKTQLRKNAKRVTVYGIEEKRDSLADLLMEVAKS